MRSQDFETKPRYGFRKVKYVAGLASALLASVSLSTTKPQTVHADINPDNNLSDSRATGEQAADEELDHIPDNPDSSSSVAVKEKPQTNIAKGDEDVIPDDPSAKKSTPNAQNSTQKSDAQQNSKRTVHVIDDSVQQNLSQNKQKTQKTAKPEVKANKSSQQNALQNNAKVTQNNVSAPKVDHIPDDNITTINSFDNPLLSNNETVKSNKSDIANAVLDLEKQRQAKSSLRSASLSQIALNRLYGTSFAANISNDVALNDNVSIKNFHYNKNTNSFDFTLHADDGSYLNNYESLTVQYTYDDNKHTEGYFDGAKHDVIDTQDGNIVIGHAQYGFSTNFFRVKFDNIEQLSNKVNINIDISAKLSPTQIYYGYTDYREDTSSTLTDPAVANVSFEIINYGPSYETIKGNTQSEAPYTLVPVQEFNSDISHLYSNAVTDNAPQRAYVLTGQHHYTYDDTKYNYLNTTNNDDSNQIIYQIKPYQLRNVTHFQLVAPSNETSDQIVQSIKNQLAKLLYETNPGRTDQRVPNDPVINHGKTYGQASLTEKENFITPDEVKITNVKSISKETPNGSPYQILDFDMQIPGIEHMGIATAIRENVKLIHPHTSPYNRPYRDNYGLSFELDSPFQLNTDPIKSTNYTNDHKNLIDILGQHSDHLFNDIKDYNQIDQTYGQSNLTQDYQQALNTITFSVNGQNQQVIPVLNITKDDPPFNASAKGLAGYGQIIFYDQTSGLNLDQTAINFSGAVGDTVNINSTSAMNWLKQNHYAVVKGYNVPTKEPILDTKKTIIRIPVVHVATSVAKVSYVDEDTNHVLKSVTQTNLDADGIKQNMEHYDATQFKRDQHRYNVLNGYTYSHMSHSTEPYNNPDGSTITQDDYTVYVKPNKPVEQIQHRIYVFVDSDTGQVIERDDVSGTYEEGIKTFTTHIHGYDRIDRYAEYAINENPDYNAATKVITTADVAIPTSMELSYKESYGDICIETYDLSTNTLKYRFLNINDTSTWQNQNDIKHTAKTYIWLKKDPVQEQHYTFNFIDQSTGKVIETDNATCDKFNTDMSNNYNITTHIPSDYIITDGRISCADGSSVGSALNLFGHSIYNDTEIHFNFPPYKANVTKYIIAEWDYNTQNLQWWFINGNTDYTRSANGAIFNIYLKHKAIQRDITFIDHDTGEVIETDTFSANPGETNKSIATHVPNGYETLAFSDSNNYNKASKCDPNDHELSWATRFDNTQYAYFDWNVQSNTLSYDYINDSSPSHFYVWLGHTKSKMPDEEIQRTYHIVQQMPTVNGKKVYGDDKVVDTWNVNIHRTRVKDNVTGDITYGKWTTDTYWNSLYDWSTNPMPQSIAHAATLNETNHQAAWDCQDSHDAITYHGSLQSNPSTFINHLPGYTEKFKNANYLNIKTSKGPNNNYVAWIDFAPDPFNYMGTDDNNYEIDPNKVPPSQDLYITYEPITQKTTINYIDDDDNGKIIHQDPLSGGTDQTIGVTYNIPRNYELTNGTINDLQKSYTFNATSNSPIEVHVKHQHAKMPENYIVTRTLHLLINGKPTNTIIQDIAKISRSDDQDLVTGKWTYSNWSQASWPSYNKDELAKLFQDKGYTNVTANAYKFMLDGKEIQSLPSVDIKPTTQNETHDLDAIPEAFDRQVRYIDIDTKQVMSTDSVHGIKGTIVTITDPNIPFKYELVNNKDKVINVPILQTKEENANTPYDVYIRSAKIFIPHNKPHHKGELIYNDSTPDLVYPNNVDYGDLNQTVTRTINIYQPDGVINQIVQKVVLYRDATYDLAHHTTTYTDWKSDGDRNWEKVIAPTFEDYVPNQSTVPEVTPNPDQGDVTVDITYTDDGSTVLLAYNDVDASSTEFARYNETGDPNSTIHIDWADKINSDMQGYEAVPGQVINGQKLDDLLEAYKNGNIDGSKLAYTLSDVNKPIVIKIRHKISDISNTDPKAKANTQRTLTVVDPMGNEHTIVEHVNFKRTATLDHATSVVSYGDWQVAGGFVQGAQLDSTGDHLVITKNEDKYDIKASTDSTYVMPAIEVPYYNGYSATSDITDNKGNQIDVNENNTSGFLPSTTVNPDSPNKSYIVTYHGHVRSNYYYFVDDDNHEQLVDGYFSFSKDSGDTFTQTITPPPNFDFVHPSDAHVTYTFEPNQPDVPIVIHLKHSTHVIKPGSRDSMAYNAHVVTQYITIVEPDGELNKSERKVTFVRDTTRDDETGQLTYGAWHLNTGSANYDFSNIDVPSITGYKVKVENSGSLIVNGNSSDVYTTVTYVPDKTKITVSFVDDDSNDSAVSNIAYTGDYGKGGLFNLTIPTNYKLASGQNLPTDYKFGTTPDTVIIHLVHGTRKAHEAQTYTRTIEFVDKATGDSIAPNAKQVVTIYRDGIKDLVTGATHMGTWSTANFNAYGAINIQGYKAETSRIPEANATNNITAKIYYTKIQTAPNEQEQRPDVMHTGINQKTNNKSNDLFDNVKASAKSSSSTPIFKLNALNDATNLANTINTLGNANSSPKAGTSYHYVPHFAPSTVKAYNYMPHFAPTIVKIYQSIPTFANPDKLMYNTLNVKEALLGFRRATGQDMNNAYLARMYGMTSSKAAKAIPSSDAQKALAMLYGASFAAMPNTDNDVEDLTHANDLPDLNNGDQSIPAADPDAAEKDAPTSVEHTANNDTTLSYEKTNNGANEVVNKVANDTASEVVNNDSASSKILTHDVVDDSGIDTSETTHTADVNGPTADNVAQSTNNTNAETANNSNKAEPDDNSISAKVPNNNTNIDTKADNTSASQNNSNVQTSQDVNTVNDSDDIVPNDPNSDAIQNSNNAPQKDQTNSNDANTAKPNKAKKQKASIGTIKPRRKAVNTSNNSDSNNVTPSGVGSGPQAINSNVKHSPSKNVSDDSNSSMKRLPQTGSTNNNLVLLGTALATIALLLGQAKPKKKHN